MIEFMVELVPSGVDGVSVLRPVGSIDANAAPILESHFEKLCAQGIKHVVVDFSKSDFISSAGIGIFLGTVSLLRETGGNIYFMDVPSHIDEVFELINLKSFFKSVDSVADLESVTGARQKG
jgi:anti-sigma B factor antagonist